MNSFINYLIYKLEYYETMGNTTRDINTIGIQSISTIDDNTDNWLNHPLDYLLLYDTRLQDCLVLIKQIKAL